MIINTGQRTDIPAFYSEWFFNRVREGFVMTRNPYDPRRISRYKLDPETVDAICFCSKNPAPMIPRLSELSAFRQYWHVTITPYGRDIEPFVPPKEEVMESFRRLSDIVGKNRIVWRYDPIFISGKYTLENHLETFARMAAELSGYTDVCVISFIDLYAKTRRNFQEARAVTREERARIGEGFARIAAEHGIRLRACAEGTDLERFGIDCRGCMTREALEEALGERLLITGKRTAREACDCLLEHDIGAYNTCGHGCLYCYANYDRKTVEENSRIHDPRSPLLIGRPGKDDMIKEVAAKSYIDCQYSLFDNRH